MQPSGICKQTCRTGRNKISQMCMKEQFPKAPLFLPVHSKFLSFPREAMRKRENKIPLQTLQEGRAQILQKEFIILTSNWGRERGGEEEDNSGKVSICPFIMISTHASIHVAEHPVVPRHLHCLTALYKSCLSYTGFMF